MIVRILGEGQFELREDQVAALEELDQQLVAALDSGDESRFTAALTRLVQTVRSDGTPVATDRFVPSDLTLPHESATLAEVRELLASEDVGES
ncbi:MAG TPA: hypothetical protein VK217_10500 [Acidimicrobiales bacterium]|nr:hypothetical protein [Acidimicrobiales bacterium]